MRRTQMWKQINASNLKMFLWWRALAFDSGVLCLLHHRQLWVTNLYIFTQAFHTTAYGGEIWQYLPLPKDPKRGKKSMHGEKEKIKCKWICGTLNSWARFRGLVFTVIQKHIKKTITLNPEYPAKSLWSKQAWRLKGKTGGQHKDQKPKEKLLSAFLTSHQITALQLRIQLRFLNSQSRASNI